MKRKTRKRLNSSSGIKLVVTIIAALLVICLFAVSIFVNKDHEEDSTPLGLPGSYVFNNRSYFQRTTDNAILVVGMNQDDVQYLLLIVTDNNNKVSHSIHINRNTICEYNELDELGRIVGTKTGRIRDAYKIARDPLTGLVNVKDAVNEILCNVRIDYYMSVDLCSADKITETFGGLNVLLTDDYPDLNPNYKKGSEIWLNANNTLEFVIGDEEKEATEKIEERINRYIFSFFKLNQSRLKYDSGYFARKYAEVSRYCLFSCNDFISIAEETIMFDHGPISEIKGENTDEGFIIDQEDVEKVCLENIYK